MSFIRAAWALIYVDGDSHDYVFSSGDKIVDYGNISNEGLVEILCRFIDNQKDMEPFEKRYFMEKLASRLKVKLRPRPLTQEEWYIDVQKKLKANRGIHLGPLPTRQKYAGKETQK